ncbi:MAG: hypothetical protein IKZ88_08060 [Neisseriaceae bacterium]|nr:hypothetical protein [Neisseriaceae bacterium]
MKLNTILKLKNASYKTGQFAWYFTVACIVEVLIALICVLLPNKPLLLLPETLLLWLAYVTIFAFFALWVFGLLSACAISLHLYFEHKELCCDYD